MTFDVSMNLAQFEIENFNFFDEFGEIVKEMWFVCIRNETEWEKFETLVH